MVKVLAIMLMAMIIFILPDFAQGGDQQPSSEFKGPDLSIEPPSESAALMVMPAPRVQCATVINEDNKTLYSLPTVEINRAVLDIDNLTNMSRTFDSYKILSASPSMEYSIKLFVDCYYKNNIVGKIWFVDDESFKRMDCQAHVHTGELIEVFYPISRFDEILSILNNFESLVIYACQYCPMGREVGIAGGIATSSPQPVGGQK